MPKKEIEKRVEVERESGETVVIIVKRPNNKISTTAQRRGALAWTTCIKEGVMTKHELDKFMKDRGIWSSDKDDEQKKILKNISDLEKKLYIGKGQLKLSKAKELAIEMRRERLKLRDLLAEKIGLEINTAEALSENAKFDYIVSECTFYENGQRVYSNMEDYDQKADDELAFAAATGLAEMLYAVDKDFESKLPENKFLKRFDYVDEDLSLIDTDGHTIDTKGNRIDKTGRYLDEEGEPVDVDGNPLDDDGAYVPQLTYIDDDGNPVNPDGPEEPEPELEEKDKTES